MAALIGLAALLLMASVQAAELPPADAASASANAEQDGAQERPEGDGKKDAPSAPIVRRPPDDSELESNAVVDFPQDI